MAINLASKFSKYVDDAFAHESLLRGATSDKVEFTGVNEVSVYSVDKMEMNDYVKSGTSRYGVIKEIGDRVQTFRIERDRSFTGSIGYNGITVVVIPIVTYFSWVFTGKYVESQSGWTCFGIIVGLLGLLTAWTVAFGTKENESALRSKAQKNGNPLEAFKALFQNDQLLWVALSYLLYAIANVATTGVLIFLFKFILDNQAAYSLTGVIALVAGLVMAPLYPILNKRIPRRYLYIGGMISMIAGYVMLGIFSDNIIMVFVALVLFYVPGTLIQMTAILSLTDSIEYGQLKNGKRNEAVTLSVRPMLDKIGGALSNGITGFIEGARIGSNTANTGLNYELDAIAACVIGGVSFVGGIGKIRGIVIGVLMLRLIFVGLTMVGVAQDLQYLIKGAIILFACALDMRKYLVKK